MVRLKCLVVLALFTGCVLGDVGQWVSESATEDALRKRLDAEKVLHGQEKACGSGIDGNVLGMAMKRGYFDTVMNLVRACAEAGVKIDVGIHQTANSIRKKVSEVTALLQTAKNQQTLVAPAFEWAQSTDTVFIGVKFAHKLDAPACIDVVDESIDITASKVELRATCKGKNKKFSLEIELLEEIDPDKSSWSMASVGRGTLTLVKVEQPLKWERLLKGKEKPRNMHTWWQLHEKYSADLEKLSTDKLAKSDSESNSAGSAVEAETDAVKDAEEDAAVEGPEEDQERKLKESRIQELSKRARIDSKRVNKDAKKQTKQIDSRLKERISTLEKEHKTEISRIESEFNAEKEKIQEEKRSKLAQIDKALADAIENVKNGDGSIDNKGSGWMSIYENIRQAIFGNANDPSGQEESSTVPKEDDAATTKEEL